MQDDSISPTSLLSTLSPTYSHPLWGEEKAGRGGRRAWNNWIRNVQWGRSRQELKLEQLEKKQEV